MSSSDGAARERAVDPRFNVALEASAGTGKTRVLVDRYVNLLQAGVEPANILAITFTRKAAAEMRDRIMTTLQALAGRGEIAPARWRALRDRAGDITISTIDAFCLSLLREFPLEADVDPGFQVADETEVPRLVDESLDRAMRICRSAACEDEHVALVFAQLGERRARAGLAALLSRRLIAAGALSRYLGAGPGALDVAGAGRRAAAALVEALEAMRGGLDGFLATGPLEPRFEVLSRSLRALRQAVAGDAAQDAVAVHATVVRVREHFLTQDAAPRARSPYPKAAFASAADWRAHQALVVEHAAAIGRVLAEYRRNLNVLVSRGVWRMFRIAETEYRRTLDTHAVLDFPDLLLRALDLLRQMEEFAQSRYRLESRYHHVLVDECQDTSRAQWELVSLLVRSWGEGDGLAHQGPLQPSIFIVGDRKQSIYGFRDADAAVMRDAARYLGTLRPGGGEVRRTISRSFRSVPALLSFVNDVCRDMDKVSGRADAFRYEDEDCFPVAREPDTARAARGAPCEALGIVAADTPEGCAEVAAAEIARLLATQAVVRDRESGVPRAVRPGDIAMLFRTRDSHREFEAALMRRDIRTYVYKGLGFFDAEEIRDVLALLWYLADPWSNLRAAALMRSRMVGLSDEALRRLAPGLEDALGSARPPDAMAQLDAADGRALAEARAATARWRGLADRIPPAELLDLALEESAYVAELHGPRLEQARANLKKIRALVRRLQNRGYATLGRIAASLDRLAVGDEANAVIDARDAVSLMTVHASKGLEFPIVFLVNLARGTSARRSPIRIAVDPEGEPSAAVGDYESDGDEDDRPKELEETKRLLYVALTRARDRLYLGSVVEGGRVQPARGSLAEVFPASLLEVWTHEPNRGRVTWRASSGAAHQLRVAEGC
ncbi:MAG: UvrD-helicase domain-containing protein [Acidobacteria bacterium]|nr:UvrD-helicase domain-containing protein [Acidobacteriota bacterium]